jgi:hypothetical protein
LSFDFKDYAMPSSWLKLSHRRALSVFLLAGALAALFAWSSYNLFQTGMANVNLLRRFGWMAVKDGGAIQLFTLVIYGYLSLAFFIGFKACEVELVYRWRGWQEDKGEG